VRGPLPSAPQATPASRVPLPEFALTALSERVRLYAREMAAPTVISTQMMTPRCAR